MRSRLPYVLAAAAALAAGLAFLPGLLRHGDAPAGASGEARQASAGARTPGAPAPLRPCVSEVVAAGAFQPYLRLNYLVKAVPLDLAESEIGALLGFIRQPRPAGFTELQWGSVVNDIEEILTTQRVPSGRVARALSSIRRDPAAPAVLRDYALQHLGGFCIHLVRTAGGDRPGFFPGMLAEVAEAAGKRDDPSAGTAINLLDGILRAAEETGRPVPGLDPDRVVALALPLAADQAAPLNARLPALQAAARRGSPEALAVARSVLAAPRSGPEAPHFMLVQGACAALGRLGGAGDCPALAAVRDSGDPRLATADLAALRSIASRSTPGAR